VFDHSPCRGTHEEISEKATGEQVDTAHHAPERCPVDDAKGRVTTVWGMGNTRSAQMRAMPTAHAQALYFWRMRTAALAS
jgi:hypothetical protein